MAEIKFRGIRRDNKEFVYGDGIHFPKSINYKGRCYIDGMQERANDWIEVMPETVGQFTGLKDKNGKEIYEGDIVKFWDFTRDDDFLNTGAIEICNDSGVNIIDRYSVDMEDINFESDVEVIGNIYEKPNWLEEKYK